METRAEIADQLQRTLSAFARDDSLPKFHLLHCHARHRAS